MEKLISIMKGILPFLIPQLKKEDSKVGIKESKEMLIGFNELSILLISKFKDGAQLSDFSEIYAKLKSDSDFESKLKAAYEGYKSIPEEVKDIDAGEGLELLGIQVEYLPKILDSLKKEEKDEEASE